MNDIGKPIKLEQKMQLAQKRNCHTKEIGTQKKKLAQKMKLAWNETTIFSWNSFIIASQQICTKTRLTATFS